MAVKVVYVLGWVRSGSTLLDTLLGELPGVTSGGELRYLWDRGLVNAWLCGCSRPVPECPVWSQVVSDLGFELPADAASAAADHLEVVRTKALPRVLSRSTDESRPWPALDRYVGLLERLYPALAEATGAEVVVDSSKFAQDAALLRLVPGIEPYYVHLVRDPRAVAYSNLRTKTSQPDPTQPVEMARWSPRQTATRWTRFQLAAEAVKARAGRDRSMSLRYEDLVEDPRGSLERVTRLAGLAFDPSIFVDHHTVELHENHTVWGNPARFNRGAVSLRLDDEWKENLTPTDRLFPTLVPLPLLLRYGYPLRIG
jgi:Sulfotransferase family